MKATVQMIGGRYDVVGLTTPSGNYINEAFTNGKPVYEMVYLHSIGSKTYKTLENAIRALTKKGLEYVPDNEIITVCGWD